MQFSPRNYEDLLPATKTEDCRMCFLQNFPEFTEKLFENDFEWLLLELNYRLDNRRGEDFDFCRLSHFYVEQPFMNHVKISFL